ncbi:MAG: DUF5655 domain-containing protein [Clostridiales bacterium]|jgi:uncharacterized protein YdhG (YjbR/CyaY superfamily)|nr:DUF5655 domain-containing protein [Clostridiales bacterium]
MTTEEASIFTEIRAPWKRLYESLLTTATETLGDFESKVKENNITWFTNAAFAEISVKGAYMAVAVTSSTSNPNWNADKIIQRSKNRFVHTFTVTSQYNFETVLEALKESYGLALAATPKPSEEADHYTNIDEYIALFDGKAQEALVAVRETIRQAAPDATEKISWQMPTFWQGENLIHFAANKKHIGLYPGPEAIVFFSERLASLKTSKGAIQLPLDKPMDLELITDIVKHRLETIAKES